MWTKQNVFKKGNFFIHQFTQNYLILQYLEVVAPYNVGYLYEKP
jgi:hypothetical protein